MSDVDEILKKYEAKLQGQLGDAGGSNAGDFSEISRDYEAFRQEEVENPSMYEGFCNSLGSIINIRLSGKDEMRLGRQIEIAHLNILPSQVMCLALFVFVSLFLVGVLVSVAWYLYTNVFPYMVFFLVVIFSLFVFYYLYNMPFRLANKWRLKASSQMVSAVLYIVIYMKHTSNFERALAFASENLQAPLSADFKKIFWDIETGRYSTVKESFDAYLEGWRDYSIEFVEAIHLIESSLYEPSEERRVVILERSLQVILDGVYEKMLKYTHDIRSPLTNLYMLGIILPTLGLALLPLASTLIGDIFKWYHVFILFNIIIPFFVFYLTNEVMLKRPGGYGETDVLELNPLYPEYKSNRPFFIAFLICLPLFIVGILPFIFQYTPLPEYFGLKTDYTFQELGLNFLGDIQLFDFKNCPPNGNHCVGPFSPFALFLSLFIPLSVALFFSISYGMKTRELIKAREQNKLLEKEFASSLFQMGNRLGEGIPAEIAFVKIAESTKGQVTSDFFNTVNTNMQQGGMSLENAIFHKTRGAIIYYPSALIATSMRILVESAKKGLQVAARSLMAISDYIKNIQRINERLRDLLAEIVSDMKSNMTFLAPLLAGIVVGLASMIAMILNKLELAFEAGGDQEISGLGNISDILGLFQLSKMVPPYFLQVAIGIYIVQIIFIITSTLVTIDSGEDKLKRDYDVSRYLKMGVGLYIITALVALIALGLISLFALRI